MIKGYHYGDDPRDQLLKFCADFNQRACFAHPIRLGYDIPGRKIVFSLYAGIQHQCEIMHITYLKSRKDWRYLWITPWIEWGEQVGVCASLSRVLAQLEQNRHLIERMASASKPKP